MARTEAIPRWGRRWVLLGAGILLFLGLPATAEVPELLAYQGVLTLPDGTRPPDGAYQIEFTVVDDLDAVQFQEQLTVQVRDGLYSVLLGGQSSTPLSDVFADAPRYMDVRVVSGGGVADAILGPRQMIAAVPYALVAKRATAPVAAGAEVPQGMIILWDQATGCDDVPRTCPCGWAEAPEFQGLMVRGADTTERWGDIPDAPGVSKGVRDGTGTYGDALTEAEGPLHSHGADADLGGEHQHQLATNSDLRGASSGSEHHIDKSGSGTVYGTEPPPSGAGGLHSHVTDSSGGGASHYHPLRPVLFCRKQ